MWPQKCHHGRGLSGVEAAAGGAGVEQLTVAALVVAAIVAMPMAESER